MAWQTFGFSGGTYSAHWFGDIYVTVNSQSVAGNYSNVTIQLNIRSDPGYSLAATVKGGLYVNGGLVASASPYVSGSGVNTPVTSWTGNLSHNADGTLTVDIGGSLSTGYSGTGSGSGTWSYTLPTIPRYAAITSFTTSGITDEAVTINWSADSTCDYVSWWSSLIDGGAHHDIPVNGAGIFSIRNHNLRSNQQYDFTVAVRRASSGLWTTSGVAYAATTTQNNFF